MFENLKTEVMNGFKPLINIVGIQSETALRLTRENLNFMSECLDVGIEQANTLRDSRELGAFVQVPVATGRALSARWITTAGRQWKIVLEARDALSGEVESSAQDMNATFQKASAEVDPATNEAAQKAGSTARKPGSASPKS